MNDKLQKIPEEVRARLAAALLKSIGAGPIADSDDDDDAIQVISGDQGDLEGMLMGLLRHKPRRRAATAAEVARLTAKQRTPFKVGDLVRWKPGLRQGEWPDEGETAIVSQIIDPPIYETGETDISKAAVRNDIALAFADDNDDEKPARVYEFVFDSRRFERVE